MTTMTPEQEWWSMLQKLLDKAGLPAVSQDAMSRVERVEFTDEGVRITASEFVCKWIFVALQKYDDLITREVGVSVANFRFKRAKKTTEKPSAAPEKKEHCGTLGEEG